MEACPLNAERRVRIVPEASSPTNRVVLKPLVQQVMAQLWVLMASLMEAIRVTWAVSIESSVVEAKPANLV